MQDIRRKIGDQTLDLTTFWDGQLGDLKSVAIESPQIDHFSSQLYRRCVRNRLLRFRWMSLRVKNLKSGTLDYGQMASSRDFESD